MQPRARSSQDRALDLGSDRFCFHFSVAVNRGREKEVLARALGAHDYIDSDEGDFAEALQARGGAKAIIATVSDANAKKAIVGGLGPNGTLMVIGMVSPFEIDTFFSLLVKRAAVKGWYSGIAVDSEDTLAFSKLHGISSTNGVFPFEEAQAAYDRMMSGNARFRVVLKIN
jgi:alcohol dehydrogenase